MSKGLFRFEDIIGETVTIFTTSGGESGSGFTGVVLSVNDCVVRLVTRVGSPPGCALGNACCIPTHSCCGTSWRRGWPRPDCSFVHTLGSVVDIPIDRIVAFVHNAV